MEHVRHSLNYRHFCVKLKQKVRSVSEGLKAAKNIVIHLFSAPGQTYTGIDIVRLQQLRILRILCVDTTTSTPPNLHDKDVFGFLMSLCASGGVRSLLGGPPCRTLSALRYRNDGSPGVLRTEEFPYGTLELSIGDVELVVGDWILIFRFWSLHIMAEDFREVSMPPTQFFVGQPEDPARYRNSQDVQEHKYFSIFRTREWNQFAKAYNIELIHFDQHPMGHSKRKPTTPATNVLEVMQLSGSGEHHPMRQSSQISFDLWSWRKGLNCQEHGQHGRQALNLP